MNAPAPARVVLPGPIADRPYRILFICTGNICRSPMAEVITRALAQKAVLADGSTLGDHLAVSSVGTGPWHEGEPMHPLAEVSLGLGGYPQERHIAHQVVTADLGRMDLMVALDRRHRQMLLGLGADPDRLLLLRSFDKAAGAAVDVPDPYYGDQSVFDDCRDLIAAACTGLVTLLAANWDSLWAA